MVRLTLGDGAGRRVKMICTGQRAVQIAAQLDGLAADGGGPGRVWEFGPVKAFVRRDTGAAMLQCLGRTAMVSVASGGAGDEEEEGGL